MTENKNAEGLKFLLKLDLAGANQDKLLELAHTSIAESKSHRTIKERKDLITNSDALEINAARARIKAMVSTDLSTNNKLYLIMERYVKIAENQHPKISHHKALDEFFTKFSQKYPDDYGIAKQQLTEQKNQNQILDFALSAHRQNIY